MNNKEYAVAVFIESKEGVPLIRDPKKPDPVYWKLPGGRSEGKETAKQVAIREIEEEIGLILPTDELRVLFEEDRESHVFVLFKVNLPSLNGLKARGNEKEEVKIFSIQQIKSMHNFFPNHNKILKQLSLI